MTWNVDGVERQAIVYLPTARTASGKAPLVFAFHGHGNDARKFQRVGIDQDWAQAIVVYPEELLSPRDGAAGWQVEKGQVGDRDLKLVDRILSMLQKEYHVDDARIRPSVHLTVPRPLFHTAGTADRQIPFADQQEAMAAARRADSATGNGESCGPQCIFYRPEPGKPGSPVMTLIHGGGHIYPLEVSQMIVDFFRKYTLDASSRQHHD